MHRILLRIILEKVDQMRGGLVVRIVLSIITLAVFFAGSLLFLAFGGNFNLLQQVVIVLVGMIIAFAALAIYWVTWAGRKGMMGWWRD